MNRAECRSCGNAFRADLLAPEGDGQPAAVCRLCQQKHNQEVASLEALVRSAENAARAARLQVEVQSRNAELWEREAAQHWAELAAFLARDPVARASQETI